MLECTEYFIIKYLYLPITQYNDKLRLVQQMIQISYKRFINKMQSRTRPKMQQSQSWVSKFSWKKNRASWWRNIHKTWNNGLEQYQTKIQHLKNVLTQKHFQLSLKMKMKQLDLKIFFGKFAKIIILVYESLIQMNIRRIQKDGIRREIKNFLFETFSKIFVMKFYIRKEHVGILTIRIRNEISYLWSKNEDQLFTILS